MRNSALRSVSPPNQPVRRLQKRPHAAETKIEAFFPGANKLAGEINGRPAMQPRLLSQAECCSRLSGLCGDQRCSCARPPPHVPQDSVLEQRSQQANPIKCVCDLAERRRRARLMRRRPQPEQVGRSLADEHICGSMWRSNRQLNYWLCREDGVTFSRY